jgi:hypothetical protein
VFDDRVDSEAPEGFGISADLSRCAVPEAWPGGRNGCVAVRGEEGDPVFPAEACHPEAVDEEDCGLGWCVAVCMGDFRRWRWFCRLTHLDVLFLTVYV